MICKVLNLGVKEECSKWVLVFPSIQSTQIAVQMGPRKKRRVELGPNSNASRPCSGDQVPDVAGHAQPVAETLSLNPRGQCPHGELESTIDDGAGDDHSEVCFGMVRKNLALETEQKLTSSTKVTKIPVETTSWSSSQIDHIVYDVQLDNKLTLSRTVDVSVVGTIPETEAEILRVLLAHEALGVQLYCETMRAEQPPTARRHKGTRAADRLVLSVVLYGPKEMFEVIGDFFTKCSLYLQDPLHCDRNVPYHNPHLLSSSIQEPVLTSSFLSNDVAVSVEDLNSSPDLFSLLKSELTLPEAVTPNCLETALHRYVLSFNVIQPFSCVLRIHLRAPQQ